MFLHAVIKKCNFFAQVYTFFSLGCTRSIIDSCMLYIVVDICDIWFKDIAHTNALSVHLACIQR